MRILVVDDDAGVRQAVGRALAFEGYGSTIVPTTAVPGWLKGAFARIPITDLALRQVGLARRRRAMASSAAAIRSIRTTKICPKRTRCARSNRP